MKITDEQVRAFAQNLYEILNREWYGLACHFRGAALTELEGENRRLNRFVADQGRTCFACETCGHARTGRQCLHCENSKLRSALERIANAEPCSYVQTAREALR
jgi:hypothetical protein